MVHPSLHCFLEDVITPLADVCDTPAHAGMDMYRAHDMDVLEWMVGLNFNKFCTDFSTFKGGRNRYNKQGSLLVPPKLAMDTWTELFSGKVRLDSLCSNGDHWVFTSPCPCSQSFRFARVVQDNVLMMHALGKEFQFGILCLIDQLPLAQDGQEDLTLGMHCFINTMRDIHMWPLIDAIHVLTPSLPVQVCSPNTDATTLTAYHAVVVFSNANTQAKVLLQNMISRTMFSIADHPWLPQ